MKASNLQNLGQVVGQVVAALKGYDEDPIGVECGIYADPTLAIERVVKKAGFANVRHFEAVVQKRTSSRWVYFHLSF